MPYVQRDEAGNINGIFANAQDFTSEYLPDDDTAVTDFLAPQSEELKSVDVSLAQVLPEIQIDPASRLDALEARIAALEAKAR